MAGCNSSFLSPAQMLNGKPNLVLSPLFSPLSFTGSADENMSKRQKIVKEIFESEQTYISQLNTIVKLFLEPIRVNCLIPSEGIIAIFNNIEGILAVNTELLRTMRQNSVGEAFMHLGPFMKLYSSYSSNYHNALQTLERYTKTNSSFAGLIVAQESRPECCYLKLSALLITPIQRIPRYKLLLDDLLRHTKVTHLEYSKLNAAAQQIEVVAAHMNNYIKQMENSKKMLALQKKFTGSFIPDIITPGRQFIREGRLMKVCKRKPKERVVFLFSDMLLYAKPNFLDLRTETYTCRGFLPLLSSDLHLLDKDIRVPGITALFQIVNMEKSVTFFSYKRNEVSDWSELLENTIRDLQLSFASFIVPPHHPIKSSNVLNMSNQSILDSSLEGSYPLTPGTPMTNLAETRFFAQEKFEEISFIGENTIPTAAEVHSSEALDEQPQRTISQNLRELKSISEGQGLMGEIENEIIQRHKEDKQKLLNDESRNETTHPAKNKIVGPSPDTEETVTSREKFEEDNHETSVHNENEIQEHNERDQQPLLENNRKQDEIVHQSSTVSTSSGLSGSVTTKCCVIL